MENKTILLLENIYTTLQDIDVKGEKNCGYIIGICGAIKQHIQELKNIQDELNKENNTK